MTNSNKRSYSRSDLAWGFCAQFMQYGAALLLLPVLAARLSSSDLGLWFVFSTIQSLVLLVDLGLGQSLARSFSYVFAGAKCLLRYGVQIDSVKAEVDPALASDTIRTARILYALVAALVALLLAGPATLYIHSLGVFSTSAGIAAWILYSTAIVFNVYFQWYLPILIGSGRLRENYKATIIVRGGFALLAALLLQFRAELWVVSIAYLLSVCLMLIYASRQAGSVLSTLPMRRMPYSKVWEHFMVLWHNSYRTGLVSIGAFLITRYSILLVSVHFGLELTASYAFTLQVYSAISSLALVPFGARLPRIAALYLNGKVSDLRCLLGSSFALTWLLSATSIMLVLLLGGSVLEAMNVKTSLLPLPLLALLGLTVFLELNHGAAAMAISAMNRVPFVPAALGSGIIICIASTFAAHFGQPLWVIVLIQTLTQLAYNNWKWPLELFKEFKFKRSDFSLVSRIF